MITQTTAGPAPSRGRDYFSQPGASRVFVAARGLAARCPARSSEKERGLESFCCSARRGPRVLRARACMRPLRAVWVLWRLSVASMRD